MLERRKKKVVEKRIASCEGNEKGLHMVHTGNGKGKTSAAMNMVYRHLAHNMPAVVVQFVKCEDEYPDGDRRLLMKLSEQGFPVTILTMGTGFSWNSTDKNKDIEAAENAFKKAVEYLRNFYIENNIEAGDPDKDYFQKMKLNITRGDEGEVDTENVIAIIKGTEKPDEYVILTAHLDHVGYGRTGSRAGRNVNKIHNGADDDGSGTVAVLEIAQAFKKASEKGKGPKRSGIFLHVTCEEKGLLGSKYYSDNPIYPLENTVVNLNLDMIGRIDPTRKKKNRDYIYIIGSDHDSQDLHSVSEQTNNETVNLDLDYRYNDKDDPNRFYYRSDHYNFAKYGIPIIFYFSGTHEDYHMPTDDPDKIEYDLLELRSKLIFHTAWNIANRDKRIVVDPKPELDKFTVDKEKLKSYAGTYGSKDVPIMM